MITIPCEFIVEGVVTGAAKVFHVVGRCGDSSFRVGDIFDQLTYPGEESRPVRLKINRISAYQRSIDEIGWGMTAKVDVEGVGVELLRPRAVLLVTRPHGPQTPLPTAQSQATSDV